MRLDIWNTFATNNKSTEIINRIFMYLIILLYYVFIKIIENQVGFSTFDFSLILK